MPDFSFLPDQLEKNKGPMAFLPDKPGEENIDLPDQPDFSFLPDQTDEGQAGGLLTAIKDRVVSLSKKLPKIKQAPSSTELVAGLLSKKDQGPAPAQPPKEPKKPEEPVKPMAKAMAQVVSKSLGIVAFDPILTSDPVARKIGAATAGVAGTLEGTLASVPAFEALLEKDTFLGRKAQEGADYLKAVAEATMPDDPTFADQLASGAGSMAIFMAPGVGAARAVTLIPRMGALAIRLAPMVGAGVSAILEAATEAGGVYQDQIGKGINRKESAKSAFHDFWTNVIIIGVTNKLGFFGEKGSTLTKAIKSMGLESIQEMSQEILGTVTRNLSNRVPEEINWENVVTAGAVGGVLGLAGGGVAGFATEVSPETIGEQGTLYLKERYPKFLKYVSDKKYDLPFEKMVVAVSNAVAKGEAVNLHGGTADEAEIAVRDEMDRQAKPIEPLPERAPKQTFDETLDEFASEVIDDEELASAIPEEEVIEGKAEEAVVTEGTKEQARKETATSMIAELKQGGITQGSLVPDSFGNIVGRIGRTTTNPQWYRTMYRDLSGVNKGQLVRALQKIETGKPLTKTQEELVGLAMQYHQKEIGEAGGEFTDISALEIGEEATGKFVQPAKGAEKIGVKEEIETEEKFFKPEQVQLDAKEAAQAVLTANRIDDEVIVDLVDGIAVDNEAFKKGYGVEFEQDQLEILGATYPKGTKGRMNTIIELAKGADVQTGRHEAFHAVTNLILDEVEKKVILNKYKNMETAADAFADYRHKDLIPTDSAVTRVFNKILTFLKRLGNYFREGRFETADDIFIRIERGETGAPAATGETTQFQVRPRAATFFSKMERVAQNLPAKAQGSQILSTLKNQGVKAEEIEWSGIEEWLKDQKGTIQKEAVLEFIKNNGVQVTEIEKLELEHGSVANITSDDHAELFRLLRAHHFLGFDSADRARVYIFAHEDWAERSDVPDNSRLKELGDQFRAKMNAHKESKTKFSSYTEPGGKNYRELLLTLPRRIENIQPKAISARFDDEFQVWMVKIDIVPDEFETKAKTKNEAMREAEKLAINEIRNQDPMRFSEKTFTSPHFSEPNILAHIRFNERVDTEGNRVLFIEEVQSDWMQKGREVGFKGKEVGKKELTSKRDALRHELNALLKPVDNLGFDTASEARNAILDNSDWDTRWDVTDTALLRAGEAYRQITEEVVSFDEGVPDAPFKKTWHELSLKRMLRYAAENGFDKLAWTTGEQQAERYWGHELIRPAVERFLGVTKPESVRELSKDIFGSKLDSLMALEVMDGGVLSSLNHDQVKSSVISNLPVDVVDILKLKKFSPDNLFSKPSVVINSLSPDTNTKVAFGLRSAIRKTGAELRTKLIGLSSSKGDIELLPALDASLLNPREVAGLLSPESLFHTDASALPKELTTAGTVAEAFPVRMRNMENAKIPPAELAQLLNTHAIIVHGHEGIVKQGFEAPPGQGIKTFYDRMLPQFLNKYGKKWGIRVGQTKIEVQTGETRYPPHFTAQSVDLTPSMKESVLEEGQPLYQARAVRGLTPASLPKNFYDDVDREVRPGIVQATTRDIKRAKKDLGRAVDEALGAISTRLFNINPSLKARLRKFENSIRQRNIRDLEAVGVFLNKSREMKKKNLRDWKVFDYARKNGDIMTTLTLADKYGFEPEVIKVRHVLDKIRERALSVGFEFGYQPGYHPRAIKDSEGLVDYFKKDEGTWSLIQDAIMEKESSLGYNMNTDERANFINQLMRGYYRGNITLSHTGNMKSRNIEFIDANINQFYYDSDTALIMYLQKTNEAIEARKFFGRKAETTSRSFPEFEYHNVDDSIGMWVDNLVKTGKLDAENELVLKEILNARFNYQTTKGWVGLAKNVTYMSTIATPISAITQFEDLGIAMYRSPLNAPGSFLKAIIGKSNITMQDLGIENIWEEMRDSRKSGLLLKDFLNWTGFSWVDRVGKETQVNTVISKYSRQVRSGNEAELRDRMGYVFGEEMDQLIQDLKEGVKSENVILLAFNELLDIQPVALSEMPQSYLTSPTGRALYTLKTFTLKRLDFLRTEIVNEAKRPGIEHKINAAQRFVRLYFFLSIMGAGIDEMKDLILMRDSFLSAWMAGDSEGMKRASWDRVIDNLLKPLGLTKWIIYKARMVGPWEAMWSLAIPPVPLIEAIWHDTRVILKGQDKGFRLPSNIPLGGKLYFWWAGGGRQQMEKKKGGSLSRIKL